MEFNKYELKLYLAHFPEDISREIEDYVTNEVLIESRYIFTTRVGKKQFGYCTHCNKEFRTQGFRHNELERCPECGSYCTVKASGRGRGQLFDEAYFVYYEKSVLKPDVIIARGIYALRDYRSDYKDVKTQYSVMTRYIFQMGNSVMLKKHYYTNEFYKCNEVRSNLNTWNHSKIITTYCRNSIKKAVQNTPFRYSTWEAYDHEDMVEFFALYSKSPGIEYLTKEGFEELVLAKLNGSHTYRTVNWNGKTIFKILKMTRAQLKEIKAQQISISFSFLKVFQDAQKNNWDLTIEDVVKVEKEYTYDYKELIAMSEYVSIKKLLRYFSKQFKDYNSYGKYKHYYTESRVLITFRDYIADCKRLGLDTSDIRVIFPKNLYTAHQNTIKQINIKQNEKYDKAIAARLSSLRKYAFEHKGLMIRPAENSRELIEEGSALHHCVAAHYTEPYSKGETNILLIRSILNPGKPYYTVELRNNRIVQVRGKDNCNPNEEITEFINTFTEAKLQPKKSKSKMKKTA